jgi:hypothetical protein
MPSRVALRRPPVLARVPPDQRADFEDRLSDAGMRCGGRSLIQGQPLLLYDRLTCPKTMIRFTNAEGAVANCQVGAGPLAFARIYDWLDETLG